MPENGNGKKFTMQNIFLLIVSAVVSALLSLLIWITVDTKSEVRCISKDITGIKVAIGKLETQMVFIEAHRLEIPDP